MFKSLFDTDLHYSFADVNATSKSDIDYHNSISDIDLHHLVSDIDLHHSVMHCLLSYNTSFTANQKSQLLDYIIRKKMLKGLPFQKLDVKFRLKLLHKTMHL